MINKSSTWILVFIMLLSTVIASGSVWTGALSPSTVSICGNFTNQTTITASNVWNSESVQLTSVTAELIVPNSSGISFVSSSSVSLGNIASQAQSSINPSWVIECDNSVSGANTLHVNYSSSNEYNGSSIDQATSVVTTYAIVDNTVPLVTSHLPGTYATTSTLQLYVETDETSDCKFDSSDIGYDSMGTNFTITSSTKHNYTLNGLSEGTHNYYVRCKDNQGNKMSSSYAISFTLDTTLPSITSHEPDAVLAGSTTTLKVVTDELSICKYDTTSSKAFDDMSNHLSQVHTLTHSKTLQGLSAQPYNYYIKCQDKAGNSQINDYVIQFEQDLPPTAIINLSENAPLKPGTYDVTVTTSEPVQYKPTLQYNIGGSSGDIPLFGSNTSWKGYLIISSGQSGVSYFTFSGTDLSGNIGNEITGGSVFIVDSNNPSIPLGLTGSSEDNGDIELSWYFKDDDVSFYKIYRSTSKGVSIIDYFDNSTDKSYLDETAKPGSTYYYAISAVDKAGNEGSLSLEFTITSKSGSSNTSTTETIEEIKTEEVVEALDSSLHYKIDNQVESVKNLLKDIDDAEKTLKASNKDLAKTLNLLGSFSSFRSNLEKINSDTNKLKEKAISESNLDSEISKLKLKAEEIKNKVPVSIKVGDEEKESYYAKENDIIESVDQFLRIKRLTTIEDSKKNKYLNEIEKMQSNFMVETIFKEVTINYLDGEKTYNTLIEKEITAKGIEGKIQLIETIPKEVVESTDEIDFLDNDFRIIETDPVIKFDFEAKEEIKFSYLIKKRVGEKEGIKSIFVKDLSIKKENNEITGNFINIQDKLNNLGEIKNHLFIIILLIILAYLMYSKKGGKGFNLKKTVMKYFDRSKHLKLINGKYIKDLNNLYSELNKIEGNVFSYHHRNKEFSNWVSDKLGFKKLGSRLNIAKSPKEMQKIMIDFFKK